MTGPRSSGPNRPPGPRQRAPAAPKHPPAPPVAPERLQKLLARQGIASRRAIEQWIVEGRVTVDGVPASLGQRVTPTQHVALDGAPLRAPTPLAAPVVLVLNKPAGTVCTRQDPEQRPTVFECLPASLARRLILVGRLDVNTTGVLLFTTDGELAHRLMHPRHEIPREYLVRVFGGASEAVLERLLAGVEVDGERLGFDAIERHGASGQNEWFLCRLHTGRNREVRRLWESQGLTVSRLIRSRFGPVSLPRRLAAGRCAAVGGPELAALYQAVGLTLPDTPATPSRPGPARTATPTRPPARGPAPRLRRPRPRVD